MSGIQGLRGSKVDKTCHCEEPAATKQSLFPPQIASLRSQ